MLGGWENSCLCLEDGIKPATANLINLQSIYSNCLEGDLMVSDEQVKYCECGCGQETKLYRGKPQRFIQGHENIGRTPWMKGRNHTDETKLRMRESHRNRRPLYMPTLCGCGCGEITKPKRRFINGHQNRGRIPSEDIRCKYSESHTGNRHTEETKLKISAAFKGEKHPQYGRCGVNSPNFGKKRTDESKRRMSEARTGMTFSDEHKKRLSAATTQYLQNQRWNAVAGIIIRGAPIPDWISPRIGNTYEIDDWRHAVYVRDNYTCKICGATDCEIHAHHIKPKRLYPEMAFDENNGLSLCRNCHISIYNNEELFSEELQMMVHGDI